jgi:acetate CoA/acetoacetate CoA-transferase beta subunit
MADLSVKEQIAKRVADFFEDGELVNLGVGLPSIIPSFIPENKHIWFLADNGMIGGVPLEEGEEVDPFVKDAGDNYSRLIPGGCYLSSADSFGVVRGGHLDYTVLGAMQVDGKGNIANWMVPGGKMSGMGGAMDLVTGAKQVIVAMEHCTRDGKPKILKECTFPLTGMNCVNWIVTELCVFKVTDKGLVLTETAEGVTVDEIRQKTEADFTPAEGLA